MPSVLLIGMGLTALSALQSLAAQFDVVGVVRDVDHGGGTTDPVIIQAHALNIPVSMQITPKAVEAFAMRLNPDCVVVSSYNRILSPAFLDHFKCVNVHYAPLPRYRGRANVNWALINDEPFCAISIHRIQPGLDDGNILFQRSIAIPEDATIADLYEALNAVQREELGNAVQRMLDGDTGEPQCEADATYGCSRNPEDGEIQWQASTREIDCLIRGLTAPFPGAFTHFQGHRLIIWRAEPLKHPKKYAGRIPGRIVQVDSESGAVDVLTGDGILRLHEVQLENGERTKANLVISSVRATLGLRTGDLLERIQRLEQQLAAVSRPTEITQP